MDNCTFPISMDVFPGGNGYVRDDDFLRQLELLISATRTTGSGFEGL